MGGGGRGRLEGVDAIGSPIVTSIMSEQAFIVLTRTVAMCHLDGRRALITGASGGLGGASAQVLAEAGADLALAGRDEAALAHVAAAVRARGRTAAVFRRI